MGMHRVECQSNDYKPCSYKKHKYINKNLYKHWIKLKIIYICDEREKQFLWHIQLTVLHIHSRFWTTWKVNKIEQSVKTCRKLSRLTFTSGFRWHKSIFRGDDTKIYYDNIRQRYDTKLRPNTQTIGGNAGKIFHRIYVLADANGLRFERK